jgi:hypothetical protein
LLRKSYTFLFYAPEAGLLKLAGQVNGFCSSTVMDKFVEFGLPYVETLKAILVTCFNAASGTPVEIFPRYRRSVFF